MPAGRRFRRGVRRHHGRTSSPASHRVCDRCAIRSSSGAGQSQERTDNTRGGSMAWHPSSVPFWRRRGAGSVCRALDRVRSSRRGAWLLDVLDPRHPRPDPGADPGPDRRRDRHPHDPGRVVRPRNDSAIRSRWHARRPPSTSSQEVGWISGLRRPPGVESDYGKLGIPLQSGGVRVERLVEASSSSRRSSPLRSPSKGTLPWGARTSTRPGPAAYPRS